MTDLPSTPTHASAGYPAPTGPAASAAMGQLVLPRLPGTLALGRARAAIDHVDDGLIVLLTARRRLVKVVAGLKNHLGLPVRDPGRERDVRSRAKRLAWRIGCPEDSALRMLDLVIGDACRQQGMGADHAGDIDRGQSIGGRSRAMMAPIMPTFSADSAMATRMLRHLPPPQRLAPLLRVVPRRWQHRLLEHAVERVLAEPLREGSLDFMVGRRLGIEVSDLQLRWVLSLEGQRLGIVDGDAEASVRGTVTDLLLLASRLEDADTLFFQRRLVLTGDTELGLTARNLLERLPWGSVPLGLRIALNRGARLAHAARAAYRGEGETSSSP